MRASGTPCAHVHGASVPEGSRSWSPSTADRADTAQGTQAADTELRGDPGSPGHMEVNRGFKPGTVALIDLFLPKVTVCDVVRITLTKSRREEAGFDGGAAGRKE